MTHRLRSWIPLLGIAALVAVFLKLPEVANTFEIFKCKSCSVDESPYLTLIAAGYFALIIGAAFLFPNFPTKLVAKGGLIGAILLANALTYFNLPGLCPLCLAAHAFNIAIWGIWSFDATEVPTPLKNTRERLFLLIFAPISMIALFSCLNLTLLAYGFKINKSVWELSLQPGDTIPSYAASNFEIHPESLQKKLVINFVAPNCPYCKEQIPVLNTAAEQLEKEGYRIVTVSPALSPELTEEYPRVEWVEDDGGRLRGLFKVVGYPTLFVIDLEGKITKVIPGLPTNLQQQLTSH